MKLAAWLAGAAAASVGLAACLLADPGPTLPRPQDYPPFIETANVQPGEGVIVTTLPLNFSVPIIQVDTTKTYQWEVFIDYDPIMGSVVARSGSGTSDDKAIPFQLVPGDVTGEGCHTIQFIVAYGFGTEGTGLHTPVAPGGNSVTWFYSPGGDLAGCPAFSGEVDAAFPDAGSDAGEADSE